MYNPVEKAKETAAIVCEDDRRKYYRFRPAPFYGGIATADCVGCCLRCLFCWSWKQVAKPQSHGRLYSPAEVAERLVAIARKKGFDRVRISGNEPTICRTHLLGVIARIPEDLLFILETNGILIGDDPGYARDLARFPNLHVRVSLKGTSSDEFSRLTGARPEFFTLQLEALRNLEREGASVEPAVMVSFSPPANTEVLRHRLAEIAPRFADFEAEELVLYPHVEERLRKAKIDFAKAYPPGMAR